MQSNESTIWVPNTINDPWIPEGFVLVVDPDNKQYIVPEFMVPDLDQQFHAKKKRKELMADEASDSVSIFLLYIFIYIAVPVYTDMYPLQLVRYRYRLHLVVHMCIYLTNHTSKDLQEYKQRV